MFIKAKQPGGQLVAENLEKKNRSHSVVKVSNELIVKLLITLSPNQKVLDIAKNIYHEMTYKYRYLQKKTIMEKN